jgi:hypothetical protein
LAENIRNKPPSDGFLFKIAEGNDRARAAMNALSAQHHDLVSRLNRINEALAAREKP